MAGSCALTSDYTFGCDVGAGGVKESYIIEKGNIASYTESSGTLTAITKVTGAVFRKYQLVLETAFFDEAITGNRQNGTNFYAQSGTIVINKQQVAVRNEILLLAKNQLVIVTKDNNGAYKLYGRDDGLMLLGGGANTGTAWADRNGYTLNFTGNERELAPFVTDAVIATLQTPG
jgi:hypothetical protein